MKILSIPEPGDFNLDRGSYGPACEGFVDLLKDLFKKDTIAANLKNVQFDRLIKTLEKDLGRTYDDSTWVQANLPEKPQYARAPRTGLFVVGKKAIEDPKELLKVADGQLRIIQQITTREKPFIDLRRKLVSKLEKEDDLEVYDQVWLENRSQLSSTAVDRYYQSNKKSTPALGYSGLFDKVECEQWPLHLKNEKPVAFSTSTDWDASSQEDLPCATVSTAKAFADSIRKLAEHCVTLGKIAEDCYVTSNEEMRISSNEYGCEYSKEIADFIYSSKNKREVSDLATSVMKDLMSVVCGLYILMFDKAPQQ